MNDENKETVPVAPLFNHVDDGVGVPSLPHTNERKIGLRINKELKDPDYRKRNGIISFWQIGLGSLKISYDAPLPTRKYDGGIEQVVGMETRHDPVYTAHIVNEPWEKAYAYRFSRKESNGMGIDS